MNHASAISYRHGSQRPLARRWDSYWLLVLPLAALLVVLYLLPLANVLWISLSDPGFGLQNYREVLGSPAVLKILARTLRICLGTTLLAVAIGYLIAYALAHVGPGQRLLMMTGVVIGMVLYMIPYAVLPMIANLQGIDPMFAKAARGLGASGWTTFLRVYLPMSLPGIVGAAILVFIFSLGFFVTPVILGGGKTVMVSEYINMEMLTLTNWGMATALAAILLLSVLSILAVVARFVDVRQLFGAK